MAVRRLGFQPHAGTSTSHGMFLYFVTSIAAVTCLFMSLIWERTQAEAGEPTPSKQEQAEAPHTVTGILAKLDLKDGKGMLKTDLGKPIFFDLVRPDLFQGISIGQRVSIVLNEQGEVVKVMETPPAELLTPTDR